MKLGFLHLAVLFMAFITAAGCRKNNIATGDFSGGRTYFPMGNGKYFVYQVDSIAYQPLQGKPDTFRFQVKEMVSGPYKDNSGKSAWRVDRYQRNTDSSVWEFRHVFWIQAGRFSTDRIEYNQRYVMLAWPVGYESWWNRNAYNNGSLRYYYYDSIAAPATVNGVKFPNTVLVMQQEVKNAAERLYTRELYANNIGLVEKKKIETETQTGSKNGYEVHYRILEFN